MSEQTSSRTGMWRPTWLDEFRAFAIGIVIGVAFTAVANSLVKDIFTPIIGLLVGGIDFTNIFVTLKGPSQPTLADAQKAGAVRALTRMHLRQEPAPAAPPRSEVLLEEIRDLLAAKTA